MDSLIETNTPAESRARAARSPVVIEARGVAKTFRIPDNKVDSLKERALHPLTRMEYRELRAVEDISFDVHQGEFFGIVGRNGSGKSTLLKILASIYRPDSGRVRMAGQVAPFIELGVGFNPELTARENCILNGVLMGLSRRESIRRLDAVIDFAELRDFVNLKVKNYSSGMMVRLAFSVMVQADADIMLIDEVLAVGDAAFGQKCMDVFYERKRLGRTVVLVTHDMATVQSLCHRAMLMHDGELKHVGDPEETALRYFRLNFAGPSEDAEVGKPPAELAPVLDVNARLIDAQIRNEAGEPVENVEQGESIVLDAVVEAARVLVSPIFVFQIRTEDGVVVFGFTRTLEDTVPGDSRIRLSGRIENRLVPGRYTIECWIRVDGRDNDMAIQALRLRHFVVFGTAPRHGVVSLETDVAPVFERSTAP